ncbi:MAG: hypothetical protein QW756_00625 [Nitrososphaerota archaeon]
MFIGEQIESYTPYMMGRKGQEIDAGDGEVGSLPSSIYGDVVRLLKKGIRVFVLKRTDTLPQLSNINNLDKTD